MPLVRQTSIQNKSEERICDFLLVFLTALLWPSSALSGCPTRLALNYKRRCQDVQNNQGTTVSRQVRGSLINRLKKLDNYMLLKLLIPAVAA